MWATGETCDAITVADHLFKTGAMQTVGDPLYLQELMSKAPVAASISKHAQQVRDNGVRHRMELACTRIRQTIKAGAAVDELMQIAQEGIDTAVRQDSTSVTVIGDDLDDMLTEIAEIQDGVRSTRGVDTGFRELDEVTNGFSAGQMIIVAARPGVGKSTLAVDFMRNMSIHNQIPTLMFSLEMSRKEVQQRILSAEAEVLTSHVKAASFDGDDWDRASEASERIAEAPLYVDDSPELTMLDIAAKTRAYVKNKGIKMVVIDYLQLLKSGRKSESRQQEVSDFSRQIKLLAKACEIPIVAIAQLNREVARRGEDAMPKASDLRESGALEQDADIILLINRPDSQDHDHARAGEVDIIIAKHRGGRTGTFQVSNRLHYSKFQDFVGGSY